MRVRRLIVSCLLGGLAVWVLLALGAQGATTTPLVTVDPASLSGTRAGLSYPSVNPGPYVDISATSYFTVYLPLVQKPPCTWAPTLVSPTNGSTLDTLIARLAYVRTNDPVSYTVITVDDDPSFGTPIRYSSRGGGVGTHTLTLFENLEPATTYYWRVYDVCGSTESPYTPAFSFVTGSGGVILPAPTLVSPANGTLGVGQEVTLTWSAVSGAVGYQLFSCQVGSGCYLYFVTTTSKEARYLLPSATYEWRVVPYNDYAYGDVSETWQFTTGAFASLQRSEATSFAAPAMTFLHSDDGTLLETERYR